MLLQSELKQTSLIGWELHPSRWDIDRNGLFLWTNWYMCSFARMCIAKKRKLCV